MKKYVAVACHIDVKRGNSQMSGFASISDATQWARDYVQRNNNMKAYVCGVISEVLRPEPVVIVQPFVAELENTPEDK